MNYHSVLPECLFSKQNQLCRDNRRRNFGILVSIGEGSFGAVYRAIDKSISAMVAVKVILSTNGSKEEEEMTRREIEFLIRCNSPYIVDHFGSIVKTGASNWKKTWIVMKFCEESSMADLLNQNTGFSMPGDCSRAVCASIVLGLEYLHGMNVCHKDFQCSNSLVWFSVDSKKKLPGLKKHLLDFLHLTQALHKRKTVVGCPYWMAPEGVSEHEHDGRADAWSLGIIVRKLLTMGRI